MNSTAVEVKLVAKAASAAFMNWDHIKAVVEMCTDTTDDVLASVTLVYFGATAATAGTACTGKFAYTIGA